MTIHTVTLSNGFRIIHEKPSTNSPLTSVQVFCDVGSIHEPPNLRGVSHFIEHMCFKGTKKVPQSKDIFYVYDHVGAYFNATTAKRYTAYIVKCQDIYLENCIHILSDMLLNSIFYKSEFKKEENVVIEENINNKDDPEDVLEEMSDSLLYKNTPFQYPVDTFAYHEKRFVYHEVFAYYRQYYHPENMILSVVSNLPFDRIVKMVKHTYFSKGKRGPILENIKETLMPPMTPLQGIQYNIIHNSSFDSTQLSISFKTCTQYSKDKYILNLLKNVLSGTLSSRLFILLRDKNGLTYRSEINTNYCEVMGEFTFYAQLNCSKLLKNGSKPGVLPLMIELVNDIIRNGITQDELSMFKDNLRGKMILRLEKLDTQTEHNGLEYLLYNAPSAIVPYRDLFDRHYKSITAEQVHQCIRAYFKKDRMAVCCIAGKVAPSLTKIRAICETIVQ